MEKKPTVLIVEDDKNLIEMYRTKFEMEGFEVITSENGIKVAELAKSKKPSAILLDIVMPEVDGFEVMKQINKDAEIKKIPVILLTNLGQEEDIKKGLAMGAVDYLIKANFTPNEVVEKVKSRILK